MKRMRFLLLGLLAVAVISFAFVKFTTVTFQYNGGDKSVASNYSQADPDCGTGTVNLCKIQFDDAKFPLTGSGNPRQVVLDAVAAKVLNSVDHVETTTALSPITGLQETITLIKKS